MAYRQTCLRLAPIWGTQPDPVAKKTHPLASIQLFLVYPTGGMVVGEFHPDRDRPSTGMSLHPAKVAKTTAVNPNLPISLSKPQTRPNGRDHFWQGKIAIALRNSVRL